MVKNLPANAGDLRDVVLVPGLGDPLEKGMATHSSSPAWRIPRTEEPGELQSTGLQKVRHDWVTMLQQPGFGQMYHDMYISLEYHTECFHCLKAPL